MSSNTDTDTISICAACCKEGNDLKTCTACHKDNVAVCANCGKEGSDINNTCNKCNMVKYCNAACKKKHRHKHKKQCEEHLRLAAERAAKLHDEELRIAAELYDEKLFKEPPFEECPICFLTMPISGADICFESCCGKRICNGCIHAMAVSEGKELCAFCRTPMVRSDEEEIKRVKKLMDKENGKAFYQLAGYYAQGIRGLTQDQRKANELYLKAGELGCAEAYYNLGNSYRLGTGVERDEKKAVNYFDLSAMNGCTYARYNLGRIEGDAGNHRRALRHLFIAARAGHKASLDIVKKGFMHGAVTKDEYANTLRSYQTIQNERKSEDRDTAARFKIVQEKLNRNELFLLN